MPANPGRELVVKKDSTAIAGVQTKSVSVDGSPVDITSDDDSGWRTLLSDPGVRSVDMSVEGVTKDAILRAAVFDGTSLLLTDITLDYPNGDALSGNFYLANLEENGTHNDAVKFTGTLQSSGEITYTPAA